jgi:hypothetical protein
LLPATALQDDVAETTALYLQVKRAPAEAALQRDYPNRYTAVKERLAEK